MSPYLQVLVPMRSRWALFCAAILFGFLRVKVTAAEAARHRPPRGSRSCPRNWHFFDLDFPSRTTRHRHHYLRAVAAIVQSLALGLRAKSVPRKDARSACTTSQPTRNVGGRNNGKRNVSKMADRARVSL